jgi:hypothetical protein
MSEEKLTMESLTKEQKQQMEQHIIGFQKLCLDSFVMTRQGTIQEKLMPMIWLGPDDQVRHHRHEQSYRYQREEPHQSAAEISMKPMDILDQPVVKTSSWMHQSYWLL